MTTTINIEIKDKIATNSNPEIEIVSQNDDYEIVFSFDEEWNSYLVKTARFYYNFRHVDIVFEGNVCKIPPLEETELLVVGVFTDNIKTTTPAEIKCKYSIKKYGGNIHKPTEDVYAQIIELLNKYLEGGTGIDKQELEKIIKEYLDKNPVKDGFSPTIEITPIENGNKVTITDVNGVKSFNIINGNIVKVDKELSTESENPVENKVIAEEFEKVVYKEQFLVGETAPTTTTSDGFVGQLYVDTTNNATYQCTAITDGVYSWVRLIRETDYASKDKAGVSKVNNLLSNGIEIDNSGLLKLKPPSDWNIENARQNGGREPVTLAKADKTVIAVLTKPLITMTAEQQEKAQNWLGIERWQDFSVQNDNVNISQSTKIVKKVKIKQGNVFTVDGATVYDIISDCEITLIKIDTYSYGYMLLRNQANGNIDTYKIGCKYRQSEDGTFVGFDLNFLMETTIRVLTSI